MTGQPDDQDEMETAAYARYLVHVRALLAAEAARKPEPEEDPLNDYMDRLFADLLRNSARDAGARVASQRYRTLGAQALAFARLAGFLAGHLSLRDDPLRQALEALMHGYGEPEMFGSESDADQADETEEILVREPAESAAPRRGRRKPQQH